MGLKWSGHCQNSVGFVSRLSLKLQHFEGRSHPRGRVERIFVTLRLLVPVRLFGVCRRK